MRPCLRFRSTLPESLNTFPGRLPFLSATNVFYFLQTVAAAKQPQPSKVKTPDPNLQTHEPIKWIQPEVSSSLPRAKNSEIRGRRTRSENPVSSKYFTNAENTWAFLAFGVIELNPVINPQEFKAAPFSCQSVFSAGLHLWEGAACCAEVLKVLPPEQRFTGGQSRLCTGTSQDACSAEATAPAHWTHMTTLFGVGSWHLRWMVVC